MTGGLHALPLVLLAGFGLGLFFYGGLWFTVRTLPASRHPAAFVLASFWIRTGVVISGLLLIMDREWQKALVCLAGFVLARFAVARVTPQTPAGKGMA